MFLTVERGNQMAVMQIEYYSEALKMEWGVSVLYPDASRDSPLQVLAFHQPTTVDKHTIIFE